MQSNEEQNALPRTAPSRGRAPPPLTHIRGPADGGSDGGLSRHGAVRGRAVAAAAEEALGPRRRLRAVPRVFPQQHLQAGRTDGERPEPPSGAGARAAHPMEGAVQLGERQPPEQPVPELRAGEAAHHGRTGLHL